MSTKAELLAIVLILSIVTVGTVYVLRMSEAGSTRTVSSTKGASQTGETPSLAEAITPITKTSEPTVVINHGVVVPSGASVSTADQAASAAIREASSYLQSQHPHVARVELMTLQDALTADQRLANEDPSAAMDGQLPSDANIAVWRVELDGDEFHIPHCPPTSSPTPDKVCGGGSIAIITMRADSGIGVSLALPGAK